MSRTWRLRTVAVGAVAGVVLAGSTLPAQGAKNRVMRGGFVALPAAEDHVPGIAGRAQLVRTGSGKTLLSVHVTGLERGETYGVHLHNAPCSDANPGGGHYKFHPAGVPMPPNELWASSVRRDPTAGITANRAGVARGHGVARWTADPTAQAVVIHTGFRHGGTAAGGAKLACADLR